MKESKKLLSKKITAAVIKGVYFIIPFAISGGVLVSLAYIIDLFSGGDAIYGLGSMSPVAVVLKSIGTLAFSLMLPVLSSVIAVELAHRNAFAAGLAGGYLAQNGATLMLPYGDTTAVSGFIGAVVAGIAAGYLYRFLKKMFSKGSDAFRFTAKGLFLPVLSVLLTGLFMLSINPLIGMLNTGLSAILMAISEAHPVLFGAVLGAMSVADMGGAFSKAAFIFATAAIASGEYTAMASVMSAGITVPLSITLSAAVFKMKFSRREQELAKANLLFGICGIAEGAIPIAAKNPTRVIPSYVVGAAISGALSAGFGCTLIAPYGGILVIPLVGRPLMFLISVFTGTIVGAVILGLLKNEPKTKYSKINT